jgi:hypothetical protein
MGAVGVALMLFGPELWGPQAAVLAVGAGTLMVCGREWRNGI